MIDERTEELIHADFDACLDDAGRGELALRLAQDPEARALHEDLARMGKAWAGVEPLALPPGLQARLRLQLPPIRRESSRWSRYLRPVTALAAGLMVAVLGLSWSNPSLLGIPASEQEALSGTMGPQARLPSDRSELRLSSPGMDGVVVGTRHPQGWRLSFDLASDQPIKLSLTYDPATLRLNTYPTPDSSLLPTGAGRAEFTVVGRQRLELDLGSATGRGVRPARIGIRLESEAGLLQESVLELPGSGPGQ